MARFRLTCALEPDKEAGAMFVAERPFQLPNVVRNLLKSCEKELKDETITATTLLRMEECHNGMRLVALVMKHVCHILEKADLLLLYNAGDRSRKDVLHDEVTKHQNNASAISSILMSYVTGSKACIIPT